MRRKQEPSAATRLNVASTGEPSAGAKPAARSRRPTWRDPDALARASAAIAGAPDDDAVGDIIVAEAAGLLGALDVWLVLYDEANEWLDVRHAHGPTPAPAGRWLPASDDTVQALLDRATPLLVSNAAGHAAAALVQLRGSVLGYLRVRRPIDQPAFDATAVPALQMLADLAALRLGCREVATHPRGRALELAELAEAWRPPVEHAGDYVIVTDLAGQVIDADAAACRLLGYSRAELLTLGIPELSPVPTGQHERGALATLFARARVEGHVTLESSLRRRDCTLLPVRVQLELVEADGRRVVRGIGWDLSERRAAQARLLQTERLRVLGQLASGVAHDLNNTLAHVLGNLQLLLDRVDDRSVRAELERIQQAALDGAQTVRRLHTFARARDGREGPTDLAALVQEVVEMTRPSWEVLTQQQGISVHVETDTAPVPPVLANAGELREVLVNLVCNALDAMPEGGTLRVGTAERDGAVVVTVADTGVGIPARVRNRIFDPFFTTKGQQGTGLGLAVVYTIVARHRGQISVESEEGRGTTFTIRLPVAAPSALAATTPTVPVPAAAPARRQGRILAVDDEPDLAAMLARMLQTDGHQVKVCNAGREALELLAAEQFDLLLTDVSMPDMDGWEVARRAAELRPGLPIGLVTGWGAQFETVDLAPRGITFVLSKPFSISEARSHVARVLAAAAAAEGN